LGSTLAVGPGVALARGEARERPCAHWSPGYSGRVVFTCGAVLEADVSGCRAPALDVAYVVECGAACEPTCFLLLGPEKREQDMLACAARAAVEYDCERCRPELAPVVEPTAEPVEPTPGPPCVDHDEAFCEGLRPSKCKANTRAAQKKRAKCPLSCGLCEDEGRRLRAAGALIV